MLSKIVHAIVKIAPEVSCSLTPKTRPLAGLLTKCRHKFPPPLSVADAETENAEFKLRCFNIVPTTITSARGELFTSPQNRPLAGLLTECRHDIKPAVTCCCRY